ncbi:hypothetical protein MNBD_DELTA03-934 [hydrothermal vent metagenome]|uniref:DUF559 domain-containing protein n=1 Tax=hydrothermal vent metagenome TaxID=652676 RepID=A0A3B0VH20_9ZZZZ
MQKKHKFIYRAKLLRNNMTDTERLLWSKIRNRQIYGYKFRRQSPIGRYIVDFICYEKKIIIELDGSQHAAREEYDQQRTVWLESGGYKVIRFWNNDVWQNIEGVLDVIASALI